MKSARYTTAFGLVCLAMGGMARADMASDYDANSSIDPAVYDPDAAPKAFTDSLKKALAPKQSDQDLKQAQEDSNWLMNGYEQQVRARDLAEGQDNNSDLYAQIASDPALAKAAGIAPLKPSDKKGQEDENWLVNGYEQQVLEQSPAGSRNVDNNADIYAQIAGDSSLAELSGISSSQPAGMTDARKTVDFRTGIDDGNASLTLRSDPALDTTASTPASFSVISDAFNPDFTPLSGSGTPAPNSSLSDMGGMFSAQASSPSMELKSKAMSDPLNLDPGALDTPGMIAAESDPRFKSDQDLSLDLLPGQTASEEKPHHDLSLELPPELPPASNEARLQQQQDTALEVPGQPRKTAPPVPLSPLLTQPPPNATAQMVPYTSPIRTRVADPFDILNR